MLFDRLFMDNINYTLISMGKTIMLELLLLLLLGLKGTERTNEQQQLLLLLLLGLKERMNSSSCWCVHKIIYGRPGWLALHTNCYYCFALTYVCTCVCEYVRTLYSNPILNFNTS